MSREKAALDDRCAGEFAERGKEQPSEHAAGFPDENRPAASDAGRFAAAASPLLDWYRANARDLPWRHTRDPYRIWVSEIMLQQTRVAAALGYYARFLDRFPTVETLAAAPEEDLLSAWQGLGYYSRARNLHRAAARVAELGGFPDTYEGLLSLPGVGEYTAGAVASAAFGRRCPAVDGNVLRVAARLTDCHEDVLSPATKQAVREALLRSFPTAEEDVRLYNQAWMELGAVVCVPNGPPRCAECPIAPLCLGRERGTAETLPVRARKPSRRREELTVFLLVRDDRTALRKRPDTGLLASLWEFPNVPGTLDEGGAAETVGRWGLSIRRWHSRLTAKHIFTHVEWRMTGYVLEVAGETPPAGTDGPADDRTGGADRFRWVDRQELDTYAVPSAFVRYRQRAAELLGAAERPEITEPTERETLSGWMGQEAPSGLPEQERLSDYAEQVMLSGCVEQEGTP